MTPWHLIWTGFWQGLGIELSFFVLWAIWHYVYRRVAHKFAEEHLLHRVHDYFSK